MSAPAGTGQVASSSRLMPSTQAANGDDAALPLLGKACLNALVRSLFAPLGRIV
jgi:hypothetical protein